jgi:hypothetical protein
MDIHQNDFRPAFGDGDKRFLGAGHGALAFEARRVVNDPRQTFAYRPAVFHNGNFSRHKTSPKPQSKLPAHPMAAVSPDWVDTTPTTK